MSVRKIVLVLLAALLPFLAFAAGKTVDGRPMSVGVFVADSFGDRAFYDIALDGITMIKDHYQAESFKYEGRLKPDNFEPLLSTAAKKSPLVFVLGFEAFDAALSVAKKYPKSIFVLLDGIVDSKDVVCLGYKDHEGTFLAGAMAAMLTVDTKVKWINPAKMIGYIGGVDSPVMQRALWGYEQGAKYVDKATKVESIFVGSWVDPAKGKEANLALLEKGSEINFQYAGLSGEGGFNAAKEGAKMWVIGGGFDQRWLAPDNTVASVMKAVDVSMDWVTGQFIEGKIKRGDTFNWGVKEKGMYLTMSKDIVPPAIVDKVNALAKKIQAGEITVTEFR